MPAPTSGPTLWSTALRACLAGFRELGLDVERIRRDAGIAEAALADPDARIPFDLTARVWPAAQAQWQRAGLGLHTGVALPFGELGALDYVAAAASTLAEGLADMERVFRIVSHGATQVELLRTGAGAGVLAFSGAFPPEVRDYAIGGFMARLRHLGATPVAITFVGPPFDEPAAYARLLGMVPRFGAHVNALTIAASDLDRPRGDDRYRGLSVIVGREVERLLREVAEPTTSAEVRRVVVRLLPSGAPELGAVARALRVSPRTLQRRLTDERTSLRALVEATREDMALSHLSSDRLRIAEIAYLLGYSEPGTFTTAFKRWRGISPSEHRQRA